MTADVLAAVLLHGCRSLCTSYQQATVTWPWLLRFQEDVLSLVVTASAFSSPFQLQRALLSVGWQRLVVSVASRLCERACVAVCNVPGHVSVPQQCRSCQNIQARANAHRTQSLL
jgi:hypothetical protein